MEQHNERLEFLATQCLGLSSQTIFILRLPSEPEGYLSHLRSHIVEASSCAQLLGKLGIAHYVLLGKGERMNEGRGRETILADLFEAFIGAIYLDCDIESAKKFFFEHFSAKIETHLSKPLRNWKAELQDYSQKEIPKAAGL